jgi:4-carboxymuconolactone decarboxylase
MPTERMPPLDVAGLGPDQRLALQRITSGPRGKLLGPFAVLLRTPELMDRLQEVGAHLRYEKVLDARLFELVVLMVARRWNQGFEWAHHQPLAIAAGLDEEVVDAVGHGRRPETDDADVALVWALVEQLHGDGGWDDDSYGRAVQRFGEEGVIELVVTVGYYCTLALVMNVAGTPPEAGPRLPGLRAGGDG